MPASSSCRSALLTATCDRPIRRPALAGVDYGLLRQGADQQPRGRALPRLADAPKPLFLQALDLLGEAFGFLGGACGLLGEQLAPFACVSLPVGGQSAYVGPGRGREYEADRRDVPGHLAAATKDRIDQRPAAAAIAVGKGMDGLELSVRDCRLDDRRKVVALGEPAEVLEKVRHELGGRWHERRFERVVGIAPDPVLRRAHDSGDTAIVGMVEEQPVDLDQIGDGKSTFDPDLDRLPHRVDVAEHLPRPAVPATTLRSRRGRLARASCGRCAHPRCGRRRRSPSAADSARPRPASRPATGRAEAARALSSPGGAPRSRSRRAGTPDPRSVRDERAVAATAPCTPSLPRWVGLPEAIDVAPRAFSRSPLRRSPPSEPFIVESSFVRLLRIAYKAIAMYYGISGVERRM